ncbi:nickel ABC transporter substrate-binding protein [Paenibacillus taichungensis]|nr:nickel ABC transporter substrate-binding protein [Paenibacillus taichungensis]MDR9748905.1 nickel ABC transporter substrate-binding protein [Paenibacillus taichungensis]MEC0109283.1 nickel ABC transporter substrate-binding protein [Paenibacillus taichungensis]MEC0196507.1 nickel ABC transporter substrate-binding protein [Paenibacillus taichungensis]
MKKGSALGLMLLLLSVITALAGCGQDGGTTTESAKSEVKSELIYASAKDINDMNPHLYTGSMPAQGMVYESLVENTVDGIKPLLAESWDIAEDGKTYTFHLRQGVKFHDGEPFNAEAVKQNIDAVQANAEKHAWIKLSTKIVSTKVMDEYTFELVLSEPYYPALVELSMTRPYVFISPKDFTNGGTKDGVSGYHGTGPYKLTGHKIDENATFEANEEYWGGAPMIHKITSKVLPAGETTLLALQKGEINFIFTDDRGADSIDVEAMNQLADSGDFQVIRSEAMNTNMIVANSSKVDNPVHETAVREAIWVAIDRETISNDIFNGTQTVADTLFSSNVNYADVELKKREYSPETAKELLEKAGWTLAEGKAVRAKNGQQLALTLYYDSNSSSQKTQAELIQHALKGLGIQLEIVGEESTSIANRRATGEYDLLFNQTWGLAYDPQSTISAFTSDSAYKHTTSGIAQADELYNKIDEVMVSTDEESRQSLYADIMKMVHDEAVFIPITNGRVTVVAPKNLDGITFKQTQYELPFEQMKFK